MVDQRFSVSVHIMTSLAYEKGDLLTSEALAKSVRTNPTVVRRLIAKLVDAGLLDSYKGKSGGVKLAKSAKEITLRDIYIAASGKPLLNTPDKEPNKHCNVSCAMNKLLDDVCAGLEKSSMNYLSGIKLSDLASKVARA
jgi:Rrf2 family protein